MGGGWGGLGWWWVGPSNNDRWGSSAGGGQNRPVGGGWGLGGVMAGGWEHAVRLLAGSGGRRVEVQLSFDRTPVPAWEPALQGWAALRLLRLGFCCRGEGGARGGSDPSCAKCPLRPCTAPCSAQAVAAKSSGQEKCQQPLLPGGALAPAEQPRPAPDQAPHLLCIGQCLPRCRRRAQPFGSRLLHV